MRRDIEIKLNELIVWVVRKWKSILIVGLIFAVIVNVAMVFANYSNVKSSVDQENVDNTDWQQVLTEEEILNVEATAQVYLENQESIKEIKSYMKDSIMYQLDANNVPTYTIIFHVSVADGKSASIIAESYKNLVCTEELYKAIKEKLDWDIQDAYIAELIDVDCVYPVGNAVSNVDKEALVAINIIASDKDECIVIAEEVNKQINAATLILKKAYGDFEEIVISESYEVKVNNTLLDYKTWTLSNFNNIVSLAQAFKTNFTDEESEYFEELVSDNDVDKEQGDSAIDENEVSIINTKGLLLGFVFGVIIAVCYFVIKYLVDGRVRSAQELIQRLNVPVFEAENNELLMMQIKAYLKKKSIESIYVTGTVNGICNSLDFNDIQNIHVLCEQGEKNFSEKVVKALETEGVFLVEKREVSKINDLRLMYDKLNANEVQVIGIAIID